MLYLPITVANFWSLCFKGLHIWSFYSRSTSAFCYFRKLCLFPFKQNYTWTKTLLSVINKAAITLHLPFINAHLHFRLSKPFLISQRVFLRVQFPTGWSVSRANSLLGESARKSVDRAERVRWQIRNRNGSFWHVRFIDINSNYFLIEAWNV